MRYSFRAGTMERDEIKTVRFILTISGVPSSRVSLGHDFSGPQILLHNAPRLYHGVFRVRVKSYHGIGAGARKVIVVPTWAHG